MMTGQQGTPHEQTLDAAADLAGRLRLVLGDDDAAAAVEVVVGAGWRPAADGPMGKLVIDEDCILSEEAWRSAKVTRSIGDHSRMRAALECFGRRLLARLGQR